MFESPYTLSFDGKPRTLGVEIEFSGLTIDQIADVIIQVSGGEYKKNGKYEAEVSGGKFEPYGPFKIELDASLLKSGKLREYLSRIGMDKKENIDSVEDFLSEAAMEVVPMEIVSPPIPLSELSLIDDIREALRLNAAEGTKDTFFNAFGLHLNPSLPSLEPEEIKDFLQAFVIMYDWLIEKLEIDTARRLTPYIDPFPKEYVLHILQGDYHPNITSLIDDYLKFNPTRNRPLDMLPLFTYIDEERVLNVVDDGLTSSRPTFHYRLPNCDISNPDWSVTKEWNYWAMVEKVAFDKTRLNKLRVEFLDWKNNPSEKIINKLSEKIKDFWND